MESVKAYLEQRNVALIGQLLSKRIIHANWLVDEKITLLQTATLYNDVDMVRLLLSYGADPNYKTERCGISPFCLAVVLCFREVEELLILAGANVNEIPDSDYPFFDNQTTILQVVARYGDDEQVRLLVAHGADVTSKNCEDASVLHLAVRAECQPSTIALLLDRGANIDAVDMMSRTPLNSAIAVRNVRLVQLLLERGADLEAIHRSGKNPLHLAIMLSETKIVQVLLENGADVSASTGSGEFPLYLAVKFGDTKIVELLLEKGADVNQQINSDILRCHTALHCACSCHYDEKIRMLLENGADINIKSQKGETAFALLESKRTPAVHEMIKHFVKITVMKNYVINEKDLQAVQDDTKLQQIYNQCLQEIERMKRVKIYNNITVFKLFSKNEHKLATLLRNTDLQEACKSINKLDTISWFQRNLKDLIKKAEKRRDSLSMMENYLNYCFGSKLPEVVIKKLMSYLSPKGLPFNLLNRKCFSKKRKTRI